jgi:hypothetical protein
MKINKNEENEKKCVALFDIRWRIHKPEPSFFLDHTKYKRLVCPVFILQRGLAFLKLVC